MAQLKAGLRKVGEYTQFRIVGDFERLSYNTICAVFPVSTTYTRFCNLGRRKSASAECIRPYSKYKGFLHVEYRELSFSISCMFHFSFLSALFCEFHDFLACFDCFFFLFLYKIYVKPSIFPQKTFILQCTQIGLKKINEIVD